MRRQSAKPPCGAWTVLSLLFSVLWLGCDPHLGVIVYEDGVRSPRDPHALQSNPRTLVGWDGNERISFFDLRTLEEERALSVAASEAGIDFDLYADEDGVLRHFLVFRREGEDSDAGGRLTLYRDAGELLGRPVDLGFFGGFVSVLGVRDGALVWSHDDAGQRWRLARGDKQPTSSYGCPLPTSLLELRDSTEAESGLVTALARSADDTAVQLAVRFDAEGVHSCAETELDAPLPLSRNLRGAFVPGLGLVLADIEDGHIVLSRVVEGEGETKLETAIEAHSLEAAVAFQTPDARGLVLLSAKPALVAVIGFSGEGDAVQLSHPRSALLSGAVPRMRRFFSRDLVVADGRVFVATGQGVEAYDLAGTEATLVRASLSEKVGALRGRLAVAP